jgi:hypothetical protein
VKFRIQKVITAHYRTSPGAPVAALSRMRLLFLSAIMTGFLVTILEAVCTGQTYLPTISFILKMSPLKAQAFSYLLLYNFMFVIPLVAILFCAVLGFTSQEFSGFLKKRLSLIKLLMAILFFGLGGFLIWRA